MRTPGKTTVALGRFDDIVSNGLAHIAAADPLIEIVGRDLDIVALPNFVRGRAPRVVLLDERVAQPDALQKLKAAAPTIGVIAIAYQPTRALCEQFASAGVICLSVSVPSVELLAVIRRIASDPRAAFLLTERQREVMMCLAKGYTHRQIAGTLHISVETARSHTSSIRRKLGVKTNRELSSVARKAS